MKKGVDPIDLHWQQRLLQFSGRVRLPMPFGRNFYQTRPGLDTLKERVPDSSYSILCEREYLSIAAEKQKSSSSSDTCDFE